MITYITIAISVFGLVLISLILSRMMQLDKEMKLQKHRSKDAGFVDLLNYAAMVDEGVIVCKNGALMAAWLYKGDDNASATEAQREICSFHVNKALSSLGNGWMLHTDAVRRPAPKYSEKGASNFPDKISEAIDEERRRLFERLGTMYEGYFVLTLTWFPPMLAQSKLAELMYDDETAAPDQKQRTHGLIAQFKRDINNIQGHLSSVLKLTRLKGQKFITEDNLELTQDDFLSWLQFCVAGIHQSVLLPNNPMYLDALIAGQEFWTGVVPRIGRKFIKTVAIEGFPLQCQPGILASLAELPSEYRWSNRFIFMDQYEAIKHLEKFRNKWRQKVRGFFDQVFNTNSGVIDQDAVNMVADAEAAIAEVNSGMVAAGYYTSVVVLMDEDRQRLDRSAETIEKSIARLGFTARIETINTVEAYLGSLPGHGVENVRRPLINTMNLADLIPTSSIWTGSEFAPCPFYPPNSPPLAHCVTAGDTPFRLNLHSRDLGHTLIFGPPGSGKSTLLGFLAAQLRRYKGMQVYAFDKGESLYALTKGIKGKHFRVGGETDALHFCPLQFLETKADRAWAMGWIDTLLSLNGFETTPAHRNKIATALLSMKNRGSRTLSDFSTSVQDKEIREALKEYTIDGTMGHLLDADEDGLTLHDFLTFEIEDLMRLDEKYSLPVLLYIFRRIEVGLHGQPAAIIIDEGWLILGNPTFRARLEEWLFVLRKQNCIVIFATQSIESAIKSGLLPILLECTATRIYLPNPTARNEDIAANYVKMGLNSRQIDILATAVQKRHYYYTSEMGNRLFELAVGPLISSFIFASDKDSLTEIKRLEAIYGEDWVHEWLGRRGLDLTQYSNDPMMEAKAA